MEDKAIPSPGDPAASAPAAGAAIAPTSPAAVAAVVSPALHAAPSHGSHSTALLALGAVGVVYGDIGTSPLYAMRECFHMLHTGETAHETAMIQVFGVVSLVTWALIIVVIGKYLSLALRADNQGEGGILALLALLTSNLTGRAPGSGTDLKPAGRRTVVIVLALIAGSLLFADGMITPPISVLGALEGLQTAAPVLEPFIIPIAVAILAGVFLIQRHGTARIGAAFGPLMMLWFGSIGIFGAVQVIKHPGVLAAANPWYAVQLFLHDPLHAFLLLGSVVLVVTGAEALYADMGHFGRRAIRIAWYAVVMPALLLNYYGQAAIVMVDHTTAANPFWSLVPSVMQVPMLLIATMAAIIASQALISGAYSLANQAVQLGYSPRLHVVHTSSKMQGQIYIPEINTILMVCCIGLVLIFRESSKLAAMYGLAVTGTMAVTSVLLYLVAVERWSWPKWRARAVFAAFLLVDLLLFASNLTKLHHGGWVALAVALAVFLVMIVWYLGRQILARPVYSISLPMNVLMKDVIAQRITRVPGTAVFMAARPGVVPAVMLHHLKHNQILHERVIMLSVQTAPVPKVAEESRVHITETSHGFFEVTATYGFQESPDVPSALQACAAHGLKIDPDLASYYVGRVTLRIAHHGGMPNPLKKLFAFLYLNERPVTAFFNLPANRVVELGRQLEL